FIKRQIALINSMTRKERANPKILQASRKKRIAAGAGLEVSDLNQLLKVHRQMSDASKKLARGGMKGALSALIGKQPGVADMQGMQLPTGGGGALPPELQNMIAGGSPGAGIPKFPFSGRR
ncbi:MAG: signal recognition particle protein, partial [Albidovulum sp.]|nr:signal recognition particle protein [Albidovulum sp.]